MHADTAEVHCNGYRRVHETKLAYGRFCLLCWFARFCADRCQYTIAEQRMIRRDVLPGRGMHVNHEPTVDWKHCKGNFVT